MSILWLSKSRNKHLFEMCYVFIFRNLYYNKKGKITVLMFSTKLELMCSIV